jgi:imidazolonepropionase
MVEAGCAVAVATDCNPGSSPTQSMPAILALACLGLGLTVEEALTAATLNAAAAIDRAGELGSLEVGKRADLVVLDRDYLTVPAAEIKAIAPTLTMVGGRVVFRDRR